jgi:DNA-binding MarR family transcriptional regulator
MVEVVQLLLFNNYHADVTEAKSLRGAAAHRSWMPYDPAMSEPTSAPTTASDAAAVEHASMALFELTLKALSASRQLSVLQLRTLLAVEQHGPLRLADLAILLDLSRPSASRLVTRLAGDGLILRNTASHDRREIQLAVSAKGRRMLDGLRSRRRREITAVLDTMEPTGRTALIQGLSAFAAAAGDTPPTRD